MKREAPRRGAGFLDGRRERQRDLSQLAFPGRCKAAGREHGAQQHALDFLDRQPLCVAQRWLDQLEYVAHERPGIAGIALTIWSESLRDEPVDALVKLIGHRRDVGAA